MVVGPGQSEDRVLAEMEASGLVANARTLQTFGNGAFGEPALTMGDCLAALQDRVQAVHGGDLRGAELMLTAQASALNAIFGEMARRAAINLGQHLEASETCLRLALKAQGQCRATLETLAAIKNPPVVFARQANINNGGQQQVNNGAAPNPAHAATLPATPTELSEVTHELRANTGASGAVGSTLPSASPVGAVHRTPHG